MIPGLECGIATMKKGEESFFLVSPDYAFGKRGVPPRIPGSATSKQMIKVGQLCHTYICGVLGPCVV